MSTKLYKTYTADNVLDIFENHLRSIFNYPAVAYLDNGSHFVNEKVPRYFEKRGIIYFTRLISHPSSTGLME